MQISFSTKPRHKTGLRPTPPLRTPTADNPFGAQQDTLEIVSYRPATSVDKPRGRPGRWRQMVLASTLVVSLFAGLAPLPAFASQTVAQSAVAVQTVEASKSEAAQRQAVDGAVNDAIRALAGKDAKASGTRCIDVDAKCLSDYNQLSREAQEAYLKMPLVGKQIMAKQLSGSYKLLGLFPIINYREAYIKGEAFGKNAFDFSINEVSKREAAGKLSPSNAQHSRWFLQVSSRMNASQRAALVRLINQDVKINK